MISTTALSKKAIKVLITGATGMVGSHALRLLIESDNVNKIVSISRRESGTKHEKLREIVLEDFEDLTTISSELSDIDLCIYCLGVYQGQVHKETFIKITCDYQKALTDRLEELSPDCCFVLFSATGADPSEKSRALFARAKGKAENLLMETNFPIKYIFRPGYIHPTGERKPTGLAYKILLPVMKIVYRLFPAIGIDDRDLASAMVNIGLSQSAKSGVYENKQIKDFIS